MKYQPRHRIVEALQFEGYYAANSTDFKDFFKGQKIAICRTPEGQYRISSEDGSISLICKIHDYIIKGKDKYRVCKQASFEWEYEDYKEKENITLH